jgi:hypothetical protein
MDLLCRPHRISGSLPANFCFARRLNGSRDHFVGISGTELTSNATKAASGTLMEHFL